MLKLVVKVGSSIAIGGPTNLRIESKSGQEIGLVFDADRSVPIRIIPDIEREITPAPKPQGLGLEGNDVSVGLGRK